MFGVIQNTLHALLPFQPQQNPLRQESRGRSVVGSKPASLEDVFRALPEPGGRTGDRGLVHGDLRHLPHLHSHKELCGKYACQPGGVRGNRKGETLGSRIQGPVALLVTLCKGVSALSSGTVPRDSGSSDHPGQHCVRRIRGPAALLSNTV